MKLFQKLFARTAPSVNTEEYYHDDTWKEVTLSSLVYEESFEKQIFYVLRNPHYYFIFTLRKRRNAEERKPYDVFLLGAKAATPTSISQWEDKGDPWQTNHPLVDLFYLENRYEKEFPYDENTRISSFIKEFDTLEEASLFLEIWKEKIWIDHKEAFTGKREES